MSASSEWFREFFDWLYYEMYSSWQTEDMNRAEAEFVAKALELPLGSKLLDVGCGYARHAVYLARMGYRVVCLDISDYLLEKARERIKRFGVEDKVEIVKMDMRYMNFEEEFDAAYMLFTTFGFFSDEENERVVANLAKALKPGGKLLIDVFNPLIILHAAYHLGSSRSRESTAIRRVWWEEGGYIVLVEQAMDILRARVVTKRLFLKRDTMEYVGSRTSVIRFYMPYELKNILEKHGFRVIRFYGSCKGDEYTPSSDRMIALAEKISTR